MSLFANKRPDAEGFYAAVAAREVVADEMTAVDIHGTALIVTRWQGQLYAFSRHCPHAAADLRQGALRRGQVSCADHGYRFDIKSGYPTWPADEVCRLKRYPVKEKDGIIWIKVT